ncbi:hypothetical protein SDC9_197445 [bioreactor metagenome]|uniref:Uncharacterized protein n=1 Tax=bioreactor metagenome TaxID=1076179 RepID=A0A645IRC6_9ZZZZ
MGDGRLRAFIIAGKLIGNLIQLFDQRVIQHGIIHQPATHNRMIAFLNLMMFKLLRQQTPGFAGQSHQQHTGGWSVESMGGKNVLTNLVSHRLHHHHFLIPVEPTAVNQPARRFIDCNQPFVLIKNFQHQALSLVNSASSSCNAARRMSHCG